MIIETGEKVKDKVYSVGEAHEASLSYFNGEELSTSTFISKYALKKPNNGGYDYLELTPDDMHDRLAREISNIEERYSNPIGYKEFRGAFDHFKYVVLGGSPMYGIGNPYVNTSISNCVVIDSPKDSVTGIFDIARDMANLYKMRAGVGVSLDTLRPEGAHVNNSAGTSTGAYSFAEFYSNVCRQIGQSGRRGALMQTMSVKHPDIEKFVTMKRDLTKVTGANLSVMITDDFMEAVKANKEWVLQWPIDVSLEKAKYTKRIMARDLWCIINESATMCAEPGIIFIDNYKKNLPADYYPEFKSICTNPCSEILLSGFDSCRLTSLNLKSFVVNPFMENSYFDYELFGKMVRLGMHVLDDIVDIEISYLQKIMDKVDERSEKELWQKLIQSGQRGRRTGLGTHGLADALSCLQLKYDTLESQLEVDKIYRCLRDSAYDESVNLAIERGSFPAFDWEYEKNCDFIKRLPIEIQDKIAKFGRRNISLLTNAPTGSISIVSQTSSGIEPVFMLCYTRRKKINPSDLDVIPDFIDDVGEKWKEFPVLHHNIADYLSIYPDITNKWEEIKESKKKTEWASELSKIIPEYFIVANDINPIERVKVQGVLQSFIDHGVSSTINCPENITVEEVQGIYEDAWEHGLKGVTVYREGSRSGVLVRKTDEINTIQDTIAPKRPKELLCEIHHSQIDAQKWTIFVGLLDGRPYEIFGGLSENVIIPKKYTEGKIVKRRSDKVNAKGRFACYDLIIGDEDDPIIVNDIAVAFNDGSFAAQTRMISLSLRHGVPIHYIAEQLGRDVNSDFFSFSRVMARVLKKYIVDGVYSGDMCPECGSPLRFVDGCSVCVQCGQSKCN